MKNKLIVTISTTLLTIISLTGIILASISVQKKFIYGKIFPMVLLTHRKSRKWKLFTIYHKPKF